MYDCNYDDLYHELDDCNFGFVDTSALKRYLLKCSIYASDVLLIAIVRRLDLDADARLSRKELLDGIMPLENYTKGSLIVLKKSVKRPKSAASRSAKLTKSSIGPHIKRRPKEHIFQKDYIVGAHMESAHIVPQDNYSKKSKETRSIKHAPSLSDKEATLDMLNRIVFMEIINHEREIENDKQIVAHRPDFNL